MSGNTSLMEMLYVDVHMMSATGPAGAAGQVAVQQGDRVGWEHDIQVLCTTVHPWYQMTPWNLASSRGAIMVLNRFFLTGVRFVVGMPRRDASTAGGSH
jgi:hypothetical protein